MICNPHFVGHHLCSFYSFSAGLVGLAGRQAYRYRHNSKRVDEGRKRFIIFTVPRKARTVVGKGKKSLLRDFPFCFVSPSLSIPFLFFFAHFGFPPPSLPPRARVSRPQEGFGMDTLVDAGLVPDTSKWKYPTSPNVRTGGFLKACFFAQDMLPYVGNPSGLHPRG